jgi:small-conductance mechanosensitive channel
MNEVVIRCLTAAIFLAAGFLSSFIIDKVFFLNFQKAARRKRSKLAFLFVHTLRIATVFLGSVMGAYSGLRFIPRPEAVQADVVVIPALTIVSAGSLFLILGIKYSLVTLLSDIRIYAKRQIKPGDYIKLESGEEGYVKEMTWRTTTIRLLSNVVIVVPNSAITSCILVNHYLTDKEKAVLVEIGVSYENNLEKVGQVTMDTAEMVLKETKGLSEGSAPFIRYHTFDDTDVRFTVIFRGKEFRDEEFIKRRFIQELQKRYEEHSIEMTFPVRTVYAKTSVG